MRKSTLLWLVLALSCGTTLFYTSQKVHDSREKIVALVRQAAQEEESIRVLRAEWSYLNQPKRLEKLAGAYLDLAPMKGSQFVGADEFPLQPETSTGNVRHAPPSLQERVGERALSQQKRSINKKQTAGNSRNFGDVIKSLGNDRVRR